MIFKTEQEEKETREYCEQLINERNYFRKENEELKKKIEKMEIEKTLMSQKSKFYDDFRDKVLQNMGLTDKNIDDFTDTIYEIIKNAININKTDIIRKTQKSSVYLREEAIKRLLALGKIQEKIVKTSTKSATFYYIPTEGLKNV